MNHAALKRYFHDHVMMCAGHWVNAYWPQNARASTSTIFAHASSHVLHAHCEHETYADASFGGVGAGGVGVCGGGVGDGGAGGCKRKNTVGIKPSTLTKGRLKKRFRKTEKPRAYNRAPTGPEHKKRHGQYNEKHLAHMKGD